MKLDFLIVGQGLAGSLLAYQLIQRGYRVMVLDPAQENASRVAAGLINPITGMRFVKSHDVDNLLPVAIKHYQQLSLKFQKIFYREKPLYRLLKNSKEQSNLQKRHDNSAYQAYLGQQLNQQQLPELIAPLGVIVQQQTGYLDTVALLDSLKHYFIALKSYQIETVNYQALQIDRDKINYRQFSAKKIIFCEGYQARYNPYFDDLPFQSVKGEILTLNSSIPIIDKMLNYGHWFIPLTKNRYRIGATFDRENLNTQITEIAKQQLLANLSAIYPNVETQLIKHQANIRPCTLDKQAFIGLHPEQPTLALFNGFGAKGSLQIPYYAQCFADYLDKQSPLPSLVDIKRLI